MKILLMGPPACGKGTIGKMLSEKLGLPLFGGGQLLRDLPKSHPRYDEINKIMEEGKLAPQEFVAELLEKRCDEDDCKNGFILDGWGRAMIDLELFDPVFDHVLLINISDETVMKRITGRRLCTSDGQVYNIYTLPKEELEKCTGELIQREDDTPEVVKTRLEVQRPREEVKEYFRKQGNLVEIDGEGLPEEVFQSALEAMGIDK